MRFEREIRHLSLALLLAFMVIAGSAAYWATLGEDTILRREDNPRLVWAEASIRRGAIYDRNSELLVESRVTASGRVERVWLHEETHGALGYYSLRYGVDGIEAAFNTILRGDHQQVDISRRIARDLLHRPQVGSDLLLSLDLSVQRTLANAFKDLQGAAVVLSAPDGAVLAMISSPAYNPNVLDSTWDTLVAAPEKPFFNRVLQGSYQPGGVIQVPILAAALMRGISIDAFIAGSGLPAQINGLTLSCAVQAPAEDLTMRQAFAYSCPEAFRIVGEELGQRAIDHFFATLQLSTPPRLTGETILLRAAPAAESLVASIQEETDYTKRLLGQGAETINPLRMALLISSLLNGGNAREPRILLAQRDPGADWVMQTEPPRNIALLTSDAARKVREAMLNNVSEGAAQAARRENLSIGGHASLAYSGEETLAWFVGFVTLANNQSAVIVVVLENNSDIDLAARIGGDGLAAAAAILDS